MSKFVSIKGGNADPFARYKMPDLEYTTKNKGQYGSTNVTNLLDIARHLQMDYNCIIKHFSYDMNTQVKYVKDNQEVMLKGMFNKEQLVKSLRKFIDKYVLCKRCELPELDYRVLGKKKLKSICRSCGYSKEGDNTDRIVKFMMVQLKNAKPNKKSNFRPKIRKIKTSIDSEMNVADEEIEWQTDVSDQAMSERKKELIEDNQKLSELFQ